MPEVSGTSSTQLTEKEGAEGAAAGAATRQQSEPRRSDECHEPLRRGVAWSMSATSSRVKRASHSVGSPECERGTRAASDGYMASSASSSLIARKLCRLASPLTRWLERCASDKSASSSSWYVSRRQSVTLTSTRRDTALHTSSRKRCVKPRFCPNRRETNGLPPEYWKSGSVEPPSVA